MRIAALILTALAFQQPQDPAVALFREMKRRADAAEDLEVRLRLEELLRGMSGRAAGALFGGREDPERHVLRLYDVRNIVTRPKDHYSRDFFRWSTLGPLTGADSSIEDPHEPPVSEDMLVDLLKARVGEGVWDGETTISRTPGRELLIHAPPLLQRQFAQILRNIEVQTRAGVRASILVFASDRSILSELGAAADGRIADEAFERLEREAAVGAGVRSVAGVELLAHLDQVVSSFSGVQHPLRLPGDEIARVLPEGLATELTVVPGSGGYRARIRLAYTKVLGLEEISTGKGSARLPRFVEVGLEEDRGVPSSRWILLGLLGLLPPESGLPGYVFALARFGASP